MTREEMQNMNKAQLTELARDYKVITHNSEAKNIKKADLIELILTAIEKEERENETMKENTVSARKYKEFDILADILERNNIFVVNETDRRITTKNVMFCRRKNKVRAYIKIKAYREMQNEFNVVAERNTQYVAYVDIILNDYAENMIKKICQ